ncbi:MAG: PH domain-containing protein [Caldilineaceae bacterium]
MLNLSYRLDRDALIIRWAATTQVIPLGAIRRIVRSGNEVGGGAPWFWPSPFVRTGRGQRSRRLERYASRPLPSCLLLETEDSIFALSPIRSDAFLEAIDAYHRLGAIQPLQQERRRPLMGAEALLDRPSMWLLSLGALGVLLLFGVLMTRYPGLPERLVMQYSSTGAPDSIRAKESLFVLPIIGLAAYVVNGLGGVWMAYRQQRLGAYLLWGGTLIVQVLVLLALFSLIG